MENDLKLYELQETIEFYGTRYTGEVIQLNAKDVAKIEKDYPEALKEIGDESPRASKGKKTSKKEEDSEE